MSKPIRMLSWRLLLRSATVVVFVVLILAHREFLRGGASLLMAHRPLDRPTHVLLMGGDRGFQVAAETLREPVESLLMIASPPGRLVRLGVLDSGETLARREWTKAGVPEDRMQFLEPAARSRWEAARTLAGWLDEHPQAKVVILIDEFGSRSLQVVLERTLSPSQIQRVGLRTLVDREFSASDWWHSKVGWKALFSNGLHLLYLHWRGEDPVLETNFDPEEYERRGFWGSDELRGRMGEARG